MNKLLLDFSKGVVTAKTKKSPLYMLLWQEGMKKQPNERVLRGDKQKKRLVLKDINKSVLMQN